MLLVALGITAVEKGCGKSLGNILAGSVANIIPGTINDTVIGAEASSGSTSLFGCGSDGLKCGESEECLECMEHIFFSEDDGEESDGGNDGDDDLTCDERQDLYCGMDHKDSCLENNEYVTWWGECFDARVGTAHGNPMSNMCWLDFSILADILADKPEVRHRHKVLFLSNLGPKTRAGSAESPP